MRGRNSTLHRLDHDTRGCIQPGYSVVSSHLFIASGSEGGTAAVARSSKRKKDAPVRFVESALGKCRQRWPLDKIMTHTAYHILNGDVQSSYPCGFCGVSEIHQYTTDPAALSSCVAWLQTKTGELVSKSKKEGKRHAQVRCVHHGEQAFSLKIRAHVNQSNPSTSTLAQCPFCPEKPIPTVHWSYAGPNPENPMGLAAHLKKVHPQREVPPELKGKTSISDEERNLVLRAGK